MFTAAQLVAELQKALQTASDELFVRPLGIESEFWVYQGDEPVDLTEHLEILTNAPNLWECGTDLGKNMLELAFNPEGSPREYIQAWIDVMSYFADNPIASKWEFLFQGQTTKTIGRVSKPRYNTLICALQEESDQGYKAVHNMTTCGALQINVGVGSFEGGVFSDEAKRILYAFNNWGPALCVHFEDMCGDLDSQRIAHGYDFAAQYRGLRYLSWEECEELRTTIHNVPQLIRQEPAGSGNWVVFGQNPEYLMPEHTGTIWWLARAQGVGDKAAERIEIRSLSSMSPLMSIGAVAAIDRLIRFVLETEVNELPTLDYDAWEFIRLKENPQASLAVAQNFLKALPLDERV